MISRQSQAADVVDPPVKCRIKRLQQHGNIGCDVFQFVRVAVNDDYRNRQTFKVLLKGKVAIDGYERIEFCRRAA